MNKDTPKYHGGYGKCGGLGKVWVDDREASNWYVGGPPCPDCLPRPTVSYDKGLRIVGVALLLARHTETGFELTISAPAPARHVHLFATLGGNHGHFRPEQQGFLLSDGTFADRNKALTIAKANGQYKPANVLSELYSEDLW